MTEVTIELPENLAKDLENYLAENPGDTVIEMIQEALRITYHTQCVAGLGQLGRAKTALIVPMPIVFEVYKWLLYHTRVDVAQRALRTVTSLVKVTVIDVQSFQELQTTVASLNDWQGSLEDGVVVLSALQYDAPVWTYNFRDFSAFKSLDLWNPPIVQLAA